MDLYLWHPVPGVNVPATVSDGDRIPSRPGSAEKSTILVDKFVGRSVMTFQGSEKSPSRYELINK